MAATGYHYIENYSNIGKIGISYEVIGEIIKYSITDVENTDVYKQVVCDLKDNILIATIPIKVNYGSNVSVITEEIQVKALNALKNMCEITNAKVHVKVDGIIIKK